VAVHNAEKQVLDGLRAWKEAMAGLSLPVEIVLVDDGSTDGTAENLEKLPREIPSLRVVTLPKTTGKGSAIAHALSRAEGAHVLICDLGFPLARAGELLEARERGRLDVLCGFRERAPVDPLSRLLNPLLISRFGLSIRDPLCPVKLLTNDVARSLLLESVGSEIHGEIAVKASRNGSRLGEAPVPVPAAEVPSLAYAEKRRLKAFVRFLSKKDALFRRGVVRAV
jgi:glycosyltransferase involved in cell wall biosynthesis